MVEDTRTAKKIHRSKRELDQILSQQPVHMEAKLMIILLIYVLLLIPLLLLLKGPVYMGAM